MRKINQGKIILTSRKKYTGNDIWNTKEKYRNIHSEPNLCFMINEVIKIVGFIFQRPLCFTAVAGENSWHHCLFTCNQRGSPRSPERIPAQSSPSITQSAGGQQRKPGHRRVTEFSGETAYGHPLHILSASRFSGKAELCSVTFHVAENFICRILRVKTF